MINIMKYEIIKNFRQPISMFFSLIFPIGLIIFLQITYGDDTRAILTTYGILDYTISKVMLIIILVNSLATLPLLMNNNINLKVLKRYSITPMTKSNYLISIYLSNIITIFLNFFIVILITYFMYDLNISDNLLLFLFFSVVSSIGLLSLGLIISFLFKGFGTVNAISMLFYFLLLLSSGVTIPMESFPDKIKNIVTYSPFTHFNDLLKSTWLDSGIHNSDLFALFITTIILFLATLYVFKWEHKN